MSNVEELMKRYKVIADYPGNRYRVGDIIPLTYDDKSNTWAYAFDFDMNEKKLKRYPHLFKPLEWWQERKFSELPEIIQWYDPSDKRELLPTYFKVENWYTNPNTSEVNGVYVNGGNRLFIQDCLPATETEYNEYLKTKS